MFRKENNASLKLRDDTFYVESRFTSGKLAIKIPYEEYQSIMGIQNESPVAIAKHNAKVWWMYKDEYYCEDDNLDTETVKTLILAQQYRSKQKLERAKATISQVGRLQSDGRQPIPDDVKMFVWQRDNGHCVKCGSNQNLEFDHIIPVSQGGSNTARNLQLLCEYCNRSKGGNLF
jgi:5-methylcytosine-specific restriction endonuclease McrA